MACFHACAVACCEAGVLAFATPLGIAVGVTGCTGVCAVACATAAFVPPACFGNDTTLRVLRTGDGRLVETAIREAYESRKPEVRSGAYRGETSTGMKVELRLDGQGKPESAYPMYQGPKYQGPKK